MNEYQKNKVAEKLINKNRKLNEEKTEMYIIRRNGNNSWKSCKYLGSLLDTKEDLTRRKQLAHISFNNKKNILTSNRISLTMRMRVFNSFVTAIFLYNSELWTLNKKMEKEIDVYQRKMFRRLLKIR